MQRGNSEVMRVGHGNGLGFINMEGLSTWSAPQPQSDRPQGPPPRQQDQTPGSPLGREGERPLLPVLVGGFPTCCAPHRAFAQVFLPLAPVNFRIQPTSQGEKLTLCLSSLNV